MNIRLTTTHDIPALQGVLDGTGLFPSAMLPDMMAGFLDGTAEDDLWLSVDHDGEAVGFCYAVPEELTEGTWNMLAIAVLPQRQGKRIGAALVAGLEARLREKGQRVLIAETSGLEEFSQTRDFYRKNGYREEARIRDFWAEGNDKVVFWKRL